MLSTAAAVELIIRYGSLPDTIFLVLSHIYQSPDESNLFAITKPNNNEPINEVRQGLIKGNGSRTS